jgi:hypothetical protein
MRGPRRARYDLLYHHHPPIAYETNGLPLTLTPLSLKGSSDLGIDVTQCGLSATVRASSQTVLSAVP